MTSEKTIEEVYVWIWLPGETRPVVAGLLSRAGKTFVFNYGRSYLERENAIAIYEPELPLKAGILPLPAGLSMPSSLRDAAPDAWGRRVIINRKFGHKGTEIDLGQLDELTYLIESGSDRVGALDFQRSAAVYEPRQGRAASLEELMTAAERVEAGVPITPELDQALFHGSSLGGARPKAMIEEADAKYIAKFSSRTDVFNVVKGEFVAMQLAASVGLHVAPVRLVGAAGKDVLLIERFDRERVKQGWRRRAMVSALTLFGLDELMARYASYQELAEIIRHRFEAPRATLQELFGRLVFNILSGNTDDHARNHSAFWNGTALALTPAYDICPQGRAGNEAGQAMFITGENRQSRLTVCIAAAGQFHLNEQEAVATIERQIDIVQTRWAATCDEAGLSTVDRNLMWRRQFLNPFAFEGAPEKLARMVA
ncbi:type II toxin-antitoxin system HipA family toxin [Rhizobium brockwellii]|uniref:type II toxin-antitoxin system HipA family toxin n=1 Tax=Rhizobium brockwellii TaxID=3019932 RepID=UPI003F96EA97